MFPKQKFRYFAFKYNVTVVDICDSPQGDNSKELAIAQEKLTAAQNSLDDVQRKIADVSKATQEVASKEAGLNCLAVQYFNPSLHSSQLQ